MAALASGLGSLQNRAMALKRLKPPREKTDGQYWHLWRVVDAAVAETFSAHPEYLTEAGRLAARESIVKRVTGALVRDRRRALSRPGVPRGMGDGG